MGCRVAAIGWLCVALTGCASAEPAGKTFTPIQYFKNYAFSTCVADGYQSEEVTKDAAAAARGYLELGELPLEAHTQATLLGRKFLSADYKSMSGAKLTLMKCIDFYHSKALDQLAHRYAGKNQ